MMNIVETIRILKNGNGSFLETTLQYIKYEKSSIIKDIALIHLTSAEQAFISAVNSNNAESECRIGIGHLRDSFNAYQLYSDKKPKFFFGLFEGVWIPEELTDVQLKLASIALIIALIYQKLNDESNYITWKSIGFRFANEYSKSRASAIDNWRTARISDRNQGGQGAQPTYSIDKVKRQAYIDELAFIDLFTHVIKDV